MPQTNWAVFGYGYFGQVHASEARNHANLVAVVDPFSSDIPDDVARVDEFLTNRVTLHRDDDDNLIGHDYDSLPDDSPLLDADVWDIVTPTPTHLELMLAALEEGKDVFCEKPPAETTQELDYVIEQYPDAKIGVDYIERCHPAVRAVATSITEHNITPTYSFHWRSKNLVDAQGGFGSGEGSRITLDDLIHDVSEVDYITQASGSQGVDEHSTVTTADLSRWQDLDSARPYGTDVHASFSIELADGFTADIKGSFADKERRYFVVTNEARDWAAFANTLSRDFISPHAAIVEGKENVEELLHAAKEDNLLTEQEQHDVLNRLDAEWLTETLHENVPAEKWENQTPNIRKAPMYVMMKEFLDADSPEDVPCSIRRARNYQHVGEQVYTFSDKEDAMRSITATTIS